MNPKIGDLVRVKTKLDGDKLCVIHSINEKTIHLKNRSGFSLFVNTNRVNYKKETWRKANFEYVSFN